MHRGFAKVLGQPVLHLVAVAAQRPDRTDQHERHEEDRNQYDLEAVAIEKSGTHLGQPLLKVSRQGTGPASTPATAARDGPAIRPGRVGNLSQIQPTGFRALRPWRHRPRAALMFILSLSDGLVVAVCLPCPAGKRNLILLPASRLAAALAPPLNPWIPERTRRPASGGAPACSAGGWKLRLVRLRQRQNAQAAFSGRQCADLGWAPLFRPAAHSPGICLGSPKTYIAAVNMPGNTCAKHIRLRAGRAERSLTQRVRGGILRAQRRCALQ